MSKGTKIAAAARAGITDPKFERAGGYCSRFVKQVVVGALGWRLKKYFGGSASESYQLWRDAGFTLPGSTRPLKPGDVLFKPSAGRYGHVGIYCDEAHVAENSTTATGRVQGAKGYRTVAQFGTFQFIGRLPD
jgi:cell wall-associated NlpC family hydrolase